jgi:hypothetical protein
MRKPFRSSGPASGLVRPGETADRGASRIISASANGLEVLNFPTFGADRRTGEGEKAFDAAAIGEVRRDIRDLFASLSQGRREVNLCESIKWRKGITDNQYLLGDLDVAFREAPYLAQQGVVFFAALGGMMSGGSADP